MGEELAIRGIGHEGMVSNLSPRSRNRRFRLRANMANSRWSATFKVAHHLQGTLLDKANPI